MKKTRYLISTFFTSLSFAVAPASAQENRPEIELQTAPNVQNFKDLVRLDRQIVAHSKKAQPATVCLVAKNGRGSGSGVVVSEDGLVLTAAHVTSSMPNGVVVIFPDGSRKDGKILGADFDRDAAMVQITEEGSYPFVSLGKSDGLKRNQWTVALGHSGGFDPMRKPPVRLGRVLANNRFLVTDTAVVGGDSGGPLFDVQGRVIGIHSNIGVTLSENRHVPIQVFRAQWESLKKGEESGKRFNSARNDEPSPNRPVLGVQLSEGEGGVLVEGVVESSPAEKAGLRKGDIIIKVNGKGVNIPNEMIALVRGQKVGEDVRFEYLRNGERSKGKAKLVRMRDLDEDDDPAPEKKDEEKKSKKAPKKKPEEKPEGKFAEPKTKANNQEAVPSLDQLMKNASENGGRLEITPDLVEKMGGMKKLMEELRKRGAMGVRGTGRVSEDDGFFSSSLKALQPVMKKNLGVTGLVLVDGKQVALGTVISPNGKILTKDRETKDGKLEVVLGKDKFEAKVLKRFPQRDLALLKIEASGLRAVRFQVEEPPLGSILTASGADNEALGIGLLSVSGRAMSKVGFIGVQAGEAEGGVLIARLVDGGAAAEAGLEEGDVITHFDGKKIENPIDFGNLIRGKKAGEEFEVKYLRAQKLGKVTVTLLSLIHI